MFEEEEFSGNILIIETPTDSEEQEKFISLINEIGYAWASGHSLENLNDTKYLHFQEGMVGTVKSEKDLKQIQNFVETITEIAELEMTQSIREEMGDEALPNMTLTLTKMAWKNFEEIVNELKKEKYLKRPKISSSNAYEAIYKCVSDAKSDLQNAVNVLTAAKQFLIRKYGKKAKHHEIFLAIGDTEQEIVNLNSGLQKIRNLLDKEDDGSLRKEAKQEALLKNIEQNPNISLN